MRRSGMGGLAVLALLACVAMAPAAAQAAPTTKSCSQTSLVRPLLGVPACATAPQTCPEEAYCTVSAALNADMLVGLGAVSAKITIFAVDNPASSDVTSCAGVARCSAALGPYNLPPGFRVAAKCEWTGSVIGVLARIGCSTTQDAGPARAS